MKSSNIHRIAGALLLASLGACGGGNDQATPAGAQSMTLGATYTSAETGAETTSATTSGSLADSLRTVMGGTTATTAASAAISPAQASRFLAQATFGPTESSIAEVAAIGQDAWITAQFSKPRTSHLTTLNGLAVTVGGANNLTPNHFLESFWKQAISGDDQLRQRVAYALSQIFVVSTQHDSVWNSPRGVANYYDLLSKNAFGNFRDLMQDVATSPMMGVYLSHLANRKESATRMPDENFAREIMQLMSIGLYEQYQDGTIKLVNGKPVETYTLQDVKGLAKVFTGWSWGGADQSEARFYGSVKDPFREAMPMQAYAAFHSTSGKTFLGRTITAGSTAAADMKIALDTLFNNRNVGPFIARRLIERLVSSNPSPNYVANVALAFADNGKGVRGDMQAVIRAIFMAPEARWGGVANLTASPKVREPVIRLANWMRAFNAKSTSGRFLMFNTDNPVVYLAQTPMSSPSVFNFYRPGYIPPTSDLASKNLAAPELQIANETTVISYLNFMRYVVVWGAGGTGSSTNVPDILPSYTAERALAYQPEALVDRVKLLLLNGTMSTTLRNQILTGVKAIPEPNPNNASEVSVFRDSRAVMAIYLAMSSPEYIVQK